MRFYLPLISVIGALAMAGCASWREPVQTNQDVRTTASSTASSELVTKSVSDEVTTNLPPVPKKEVHNYSVEDRFEVPQDAPSDDPLERFTQSLKDGDMNSAAKHLEIYVQQHPDQVMFRLQLAELMIQVKKDNAARMQYQEFVARAQIGPDAVRKYLVHAHTRLMEIAQRSDDSFEELFHRGVGLLILVQEQDVNPDRDDGFCEEMLCKSLKALNEARDHKPSDPRVRVYLGEIFERMGNRRASKNERDAARKMVVPGELTAGEQALILIRGL